MTAEDIENCQLTTGKANLKKNSKRVNATLAQRIEVLDWHHANGRNQSKTAKQFENKFPGLKIKQPLVSAWLREEAMWRERYEAEGGMVAASKRVKQTEHPEVTEMLELWVQRAMADNLIINGDVIRMQWERFADRLGIPKEDRLKLSEGWLTSFKKRNGLKDRKRHGEAGSASVVQVADERTRVQSYIESKGYERKNIFNMDETGLFYAYVTLTCS